MSKKNSDALPATCTKTIYMVHPIGTPLGQPAMFGHACSGAGVGLLTVRWMLDGSVHPTALGPH
jgi:hypothetical protein